MTYADELRKLTAEAIAEQDAAKMATLDAARKWCQLNADFYVETIAKPAMHSAAVAGQNWCDISLNVGTLFCDRVLTQYEVDNLCRFVGDIVYAQLGAHLQVYAKQGGAELHLWW